MVKRSALVRTIEVRNEKSLNAKVAEVFAEERRVGFAAHHAYNFAPSRLCVKHTHARNTKTQSKRDDRYYFFSSCCGVNLIIANAAPCGSAMVEKRPTFSMSIGGTNARAPNSVALAKVASQSSTAK